jgi:5-methylcytosine-specific restriction endonuclease McrA
MAWSKERMRKYQREWRQARWQAWVDENGPCAQCGSDEGVQVDHMDPDKKVSHRIWSWREERRLEELAKCQVLCRPCHNEKTSRERGAPEHGTNARYTSKKYYCRCQPCKSAHNAVNKKYQRKK